MLYDIIIVGGGPAGLTAAIYARRNGRNVLLLEKEGFGGQIAYAPRVENYPGVGPVSGAELAENMLTQVMVLDTDTDIGTVCSVRQENGCWQVATEEGDVFQGRAVILAAGAAHRRLGLPGEDTLLGSGVSYCAVCDGGFYAGRTAAVVGGGDSALQEALLLSDICEKVYVIHRRTAFRGDAIKQQRLFSRKNVTVIAPAVIDGLIEKDGSLAALRLRDTETGRTRELETDVLFVSIGLKPELGCFENVLPLTPAGYADLDEGCAAAIPGIFAAGDCRKKTVRQLTTAVADGAAAALAACDYLDTLD